jgi:hypothetical protein
VVIPALLQVVEAPGSVVGQRAGTVEPRHELLQRIHLLAQRADGLGR